MTALSLGRPMVVHLVKLRSASLSAANNLTLDTILTEKCRQLYCLCALCFGLGKAARALRQLQRVPLAGDRKWGATTLRRARRLG